MSEESLYAKYVKERQGKHVLERPDGFAVYTYLKDWCYIEDIYVLPTSRNLNVASDLADQIAAEAKAAGFNKLLGSVKPSAHGSTTSVKVLLAYGFKVLSAENDAIFFEKDI